MATSLPEFNPMVGGNVQVPLSIVCNDPDIDIIILAFVIRFFTPAGWPTLNLGSLCSSPTAAQLQAGAAGIASLHQ